MTEHEKLVVLIVNTDLSRSSGRLMDAYNIADNLIANGIVQQVHAKWELHGNDDSWGSSYFCSNCHHSYDEDLFYIHGEFVPYKFCPHCGSIMDGGRA